MESLEFAVKRVTYAEYRAATALWEELQSKAVDQSQALGALYRFAYRQGKNDEEDRQRNIRAARRAHYEAKKADEVENTVEDGGEQDA